MVIFALFVWKNVNEICHFVQNKPTYIDIATKDIAFQKDDTKPFHV